MSERLVVIINAASGLGDKTATVSRLQAIFRAHGAHADVHLARNGAEALALARAAVSEAPRAIVAGGGDGTVSAVASMLVGTDIPLGVLALGTLNHFAKDMRLPNDLAEAVRSIVAGHVMDVDVGEVNARIFLNNSSLGLYPRLVRRRERQRQKLGRGKWPAFAWAVFAVLRRYAFMSVRIHAGENEIERRVPFVFIGNNPYEMEGLHIGVRQRLDGGSLMLFIPQQSGRLGLVKLAFRALFGRLHSARDFDEIVAQAISIDTHQKRPHVATDGEVVRIEAPLRYRVRPGALRVIVPRSVEQDAGQAEQA